MKMHSKKKKKSDTLINFLSKLNEPFRNRLLADLKTSSDKKIAKVNN